VAVAAHVYYMRVSTSISRALIKMHELNEGEEKEERFGRADGKFTVHGRIEIRFLNGFIEHDECE
jgi:hypothetical protein